MKNWTNSKYKSHKRSNPPKDRQVYILIRKQKLRCWKSMQKLNNKQHVPGLGKSGMTLIADEILARRGSLPSSAAIARTCTDLLLLTNHTNGKGAAQKLESLLHCCFLFYMRRIKIPSHQPRKIIIDQIAHCLQLFEDFISQKEKKEICISSLPITTF